MENIVNINYAQTGKATNTNELGMRQMQAKAYEARGKQYILLKAPPASGKSRALMFLALDKLHYQGLKKAIVAVPEKTIGRSFANTDLAKHGFFTDWRVSKYYSLCDAENEQSKVKRFIEFITDTQADYEADGKIWRQEHLTFFRWFINVPGKVVKTARKVTVKMSRHYWYADKWRDFELRLSMAC